MLWNVEDSTFCHDEVCQGKENRKNTGDSPNINIAFKKLRICSNSSAK
jgi:hypothetical protein